MGLSNTLLSPDNLIPFTMVFFVFFEKNQAYYCLKTVVLGILSNKMVFWAACDWLPVI